MRYALIILLFPMMLSAADFSAKWSGFESKIKGKFQSFDSNLKTSFSSFESNCNGKLDAWSSNFKRSLDDFESRTKSKLDSTFTNMERDLDNFEKGINDHLDSTFDKTCFDDFEKKIDNTCKRSFDETREDFKDMKESLKSDLGDDYDTTIASDVDALQSDIDTEGEDLADSMEEGSEEKEALDEAADEAEAEAEENEAADDVDPNQGQPVTWGVYGSGINPLHTTPNDGWRETAWLPVGYYKVIGEGGVYWYNEGYYSTLNPGAVVYADEYDLSVGNQPDWFEKRTSSASMIYPCDAQGVVEELPPDTDGDGTPDYQDDDDDGDATPDESEDSDGNGIPDDEEVPEPDATVDFKTGIPGLDKLIDKLVPSFDFSPTTYSDYSYDIPVETSAGNFTLAIGGWDTVVGGSLRSIRMIIRNLSKVVFSFVFVFAVYKSLRQW